ncbi:MAG: leucine-rich repeat domain-containing protein, partial [Cyclobacterium sp.]|uniref:leucine-rich repeat domain-containing protein n=1 Tax=Cyclobacterium sp. TaxID=1966343 RepID=UPI0039706F6E
KLRFHVSIKGHNFLAIIADSGNGKSSFAKAGILAALKQNRFKNSEKWKQIIIKPGNDPMGSLSSALKIHGLISDSRDFEKNADAYIDQLQRTIRDQKETVVLLVDQFEEVLTQCKDEFIRRTFLNNLVAAVSCKKLIILLTLRSDFYTEFGNHESFKGLLENHNYTLPVLDLEGKVWEGNQNTIREIIRRPAQNEGVEIEKGLADRIMHDLKQITGSLPYLQMAMLGLWEIKGSDTIINSIHYDRLTGKEGLTGLIKAHLDKVYQEITNGDRNKEELIRRIFILQLVEITGNTQDVKKTVQKNEILHINGYDPPAIEDMLMQLSDHKSRIIQIYGSGEDSKVEVVHEVIIREWTLLKTWINEKRDALKYLDRIREDSNSVDDGNERLYTGRELKKALKWKNANPDLVSFKINEFLKKSKKASEKSKMKIWLLSIFSLVLAFTIGKIIVFENQRKIFNSNGLTAFPTLYSQFRLTDFDSDPQKITHFRIDNSNKSHIKTFLKYNPKFKHFKFLIITTTLEKNFFDKRDEFNELTFVYIENNTSLKFLDGIKNKNLIKILKLFHNNVLVSIGGNQRLPSTENLQSLEGIANFHNLRLLQISGHPQLQSLEGIENLQNLSSLVITYNSQLQSLKGIDSLKYLSSLVISDNSQLKSLEGIDSLKNLSSLVISDNFLLQSLEGIENLYNLSSLEVSGHFQSLEVIGSLKNLSSLEISGNSLFQSLESIDRLKNLNNLEISGNFPLQSLEGIENRHNLCSLEISRNDQLQSLEGIENLHNLSSLVISRNDQLQSLQGIENLHNLSSLVISRNGQLQSLEGIENLCNISSLVISGNGQIQSLKGIENLRNLNSLVISGNFRSLKGIENLHNLCYLVISENDNLPSLEGIENLHNVNSLEISGDFGSREGLEGIGNLHNLSSLDISSNFQSLDFIENLHNLNSLVISNNSLLQSLEGIENLHNLNSLVISDNNLLQDFKEIKLLKKLKSMKIIFSSERKILFLRNNINDLPPFTEFEVDFELDSLMTKNFNFK